MLEISHDHPGTEGAWQRRWGFRCWRCRSSRAQVENREDKRPQLSDLREVGSIEQDADAVMFVYRDEYYLEQKMPKEVGYAAMRRSSMRRWTTGSSRCRRRITGRT